MEKIEKKESRATENKNDIVYSFFEKNRKSFFVSGIVIAVLLVGLVAALIVRDLMQKDAIARLDILVERYNELKGNLAVNDISNIEIDSDSDANITIDTGAFVNTAAVDDLLTDLRSLGEKTSGYPAARAWLMAANIYHERNSFKEAQDAWLAGAAKGGSTHLAPVCLYNAAVAGEAAGDMEAALSNYQKALAFADFPAAAHAQFSVGRLEEARGNDDAAAAAYRALIEKWPADTDWTNLAHSRILFLEVSSAD
jgi:tetratricopeptide (TPR) repeat protein